MHQNCYYELRILLWIFISHKNNCCEEDRHTHTLAEPYSVRQIFSQAWTVRLLLEPVDQHTYGYLHEGPPYEQRRKAVNLKGATYQL